MLDVLRSWKETWGGGGGGGDADFTNRISKDLGKRSFISFFKKIKIPIIRTHFFNALNFSSFFFYIMQKCSTIRATVNVPLNRLVYFPPLWPNTHDVSQETSHCANSTRVYEPWGDVFMKIRYAQRGVRWGGLEESLLLIFKWR